MGLEESAEQVIRSLPVPSSGTLLVCIEEFMAAGKSALAEAVAAGAAAPVTVVHADQLYVPETRDWRSWTPNELRGHLRPPAT